MNEYSHFNLIMLNFSDMSNAFHISIEVVYTVWHISYSIFGGKYIWQLKKNLCN